MKSFWSLIILCLLFGEGGATRYLSRFNATKDPTHYQQELIAADSLAREITKLHGKGLRSEIIAEEILKNWESFLVSYRANVQQVSGVMHEKDSFAFLYKQFIHVFGWAQIPISQLIDIFEPLAVKGSTWFQPYAGSGYLAFQLASTVGLNIDPFDSYTPHHRQWIHIRRNPTTPFPVTQYTSMILSHPCATSDRCWHHLHEFTTKSTGETFVYIGEPMGNCCGNDHMWKFLCKHWELRDLREVTGGFMGSYDDVLVFTRVCDENGCQKPSRIPETCDAGDVSCAGGEEATKIQEFRMFCEREQHKHDSKHEL
jgi:hypothetical protein